VEKREVVVVGGEGPDFRGVEENGQSVLGEFDGEDVEEDVDEESERERVSVMVGYIMLYACAVYEACWKLMHYLMFLVLVLNLIDSRSQGGRYVQRT
jgi:hypothetical protein